jgi:hypothetical protein
MKKAGCIKRLDLSDWSDLIFTGSKGHITLKQSCPTTHHESTWGRRRYKFHSFLTLALNGGKWSASHPGWTSLLRESIADTHCTESSMGPTTSPNTEAETKIV